MLCQCLTKRWRLAALLLVNFVALLGSPLALADTITFGGVITQSTQDGTGPAVNNPSLNNILDGDPYTVTLTLPSPVTGAGTFALGAASALFSDPSVGASEGSVSSASLTISQNGGTATVSLLTCLSTGSGCAQGNELTANFTIPWASLNSQNVPASAIPALSPPVSLFEDDGATNIFGSIATYSYSTPSVVPLPPTVWLALSGIAGLFAASRRKSAMRPIVTGLSIDQALQPRRTV